MEHLAKTQLYLIPENEKHFSPMQIAALGPYLQGVLMENLNGEYAQYLHSLAFNPYSQHCRCERDGKIIWQINALNDEAARNIAEAVARMDSVDLHAVNEHFAIEKSTTETTAIVNLTNLIKESDVNKFHVRFLTPTSFKSQGEYINMPNTRLILQNLLMHYNQIYAGDGEAEEETIEYLAKCTKISSYRLQSQYFPHTKKSESKIPGFAGEATISVKGPQPVHGLVDMLLHFGEYAGVGIKTAMGMGAMIVKRSEESSSKAK